MKKRVKFATLGGLYIIGAIAYIFYPSSSKAGGNKYKVEPIISIEPYKSDAVRVSESYEWIIDSYIGSVENRLDVMNQGVNKVGGKLDVVEKKIDSLGKRLERIEKALNIEEEKPKSK